MRSASLFLTASALAACTGFTKVAEPTELDPLRPSDPQAKEVKDPPKVVTVPDFECAEAWRVEQKVNAACASRHTETVRSELTTSALQIALTQSGKRYITVYEAAFADEGSLAILSRDAADLSFAIEELRGGPFTTLGIEHALTVVGESAHLVFLESGSSNEVRYRRLDVPSSEELLFASAPKGKVGVTADASGHVVAAFYNGSGASGGILERRRDPLTNQWSTPRTVVSGLALDAPGSGDFSLAINAFGHPEIAYNYGITFALSNPRHKYFNGTEWSQTKTFDNNVPNFVSGQFVNLGLFQSEKISVYYNRNQDLAELRLARWTGENDQVTPEVLDQNIAAEAQPRYGVAMQIDSTGLVHMAHLDPTQETARVIYRRQAHVGNQIKWLVDVVDNDAGSLQVAPLVALVLDGADRPHIAYFNSHEGKVYYATK